jgi:hypothetical protein
MRPAPCPPRPLCRPPPPLQVLEQLTGQVPVFGKARFTVRSFSIRRNEKISCFVTVRGEKAMQLLVRARRGRKVGVGADGGAGGRTSTHPARPLPHAASAGRCPEGQGVRAREEELLGDRQLRWGQPIDRPLGGSCCKRGWQRAWAPAARSEGQGGCARGLIAASVCPSH